MWSNPQFSAELVTFTEEILNEKFRFLCNNNEFRTLPNIEDPAFLVNGF